MHFGKNKFLYFRIIINFGNCRNFSLIIWSFNEEQICYIYPGCVVGQHCFLKFHLYCILENSLKITFNFI